MPKPIQANMFHEGSTCPFCQERIISGQRIIICPDCGCAQHESCWSHNGSCASYHCDKNVTSSQPNFQPELTISQSDLENITVPPKPKKKTPEEVAKYYLPAGKTKHSILALISLIFSAGALIGVAGIFTHQIALFIISLLIAMLSALLGVIALVRINLNQRISGGLTAALSIFFSCAMIIFCFLMLHMMSTNQAAEQRIDLQLSNKPTEEQLKSLPPSKSDALKANAVIKCSSSGLFSNMTFGSGVITKIKEKQAFILTNKHVIGIIGTKIKPENKISVSLYNGETSSGTVVWLAPGNIDIAIISCEVLTLETFKTIKVRNTVIAPSQPVFAIGNPMNFFWSYTEGVISSIRIKKNPTCNLEVYQTQTPINQGNSGGGLYSMKGVLIGINTWTLNKSFAEGLNFSISTKSIVELLGNRALEFLSLAEGEE